MRRPALWRAIGLGCLLLGAGDGADLEDVEALVQTSLESQSLLENHLAAFRLMSEAMSLGLAGSKPKKREGEHPKEKKKNNVLQNIFKKGDEEKKKNVLQNIFKKSDEEGGLAKLFSAKPKESKAVQKKESPLQQLFKDPQAGCSHGDFDAVSKQLRDLATEYLPKFEEAKALHDQQAVDDYFEDLLPRECNPKKILTGSGIKWNPLQYCITNFTHMTPECAQCPIKLLQKVVGKTLLDIPFSCAGKCGPLLTSAKKCDKDWTALCTEDLVQCVACVQTPLLEFSKCAKTPSMAELPSRFEAINTAVGEGRAKVVEMLQKQRDAGREELDDVLKNDSSYIGQVLFLTVNSAMD